MRKTIILFQLLFLLFVEIHGQVITVSNVEFFVQNKKMQIAFDIDGISNNSEYAYSLCVKVIKKNSLDIINPKTLSGDLNDIITNGRKTIEWEILKDVKYLDGEYIVEINICDQKQLFKLGIEKKQDPKYITNPLQTNFENKRKSTNSYPLLMLILGGGSKIYSSGLYKKYESSTNQTEIDKFYNSANLFNKTAVVSSGIGIIWAIINISNQSKKKALSINKLGYNSLSIAFTLNH